MAITVKARIHNNVPGILSKISAKLLSSGLRFQSSETLKDPGKDLSELHVVISGNCDDPTLLGEQLSTIPGVDSILEMYQPESELTVNGAMFKKAYLTPREKWWQDDPKPTIGVFFVMHMVSLRGMVSKLQGAVAEKKVDSKVISAVLSNQWPAFEYAEKADPRSVSLQQFFSILNTMIDAVTEIMGKNLVKQKLANTNKLYKERTGSDASAFSRQIKLMS